MPYVECDTTSMKALTAGRGVSVGGAGLIAFEVPTMPDLIAVRWNGDTGSPALRPATAQELSAAVDEERDIEAGLRLNDEVLKVLRDLLLDIEQRLRAAGEMSTIPSVAAATNKAEYTAALKALIKAEIA